MMVASVVASALDHRCAAELTAPDHQRIIEHPRCLRSLTRAARLGRFSQFFEIRRESAVLVPGFVKQLHEAHAALDQRRANRQLFAKDDFPGSAPYISRMCCGSWLNAVASGS